MIYRFFAVMAAFCSICQAAPSVTYTKGSDGGAAHQFKNPCKVTIQADPARSYSKTLYLNQQSYSFPVQAKPASGWKAVSAKYLTNFNGGNEVTIDLGNSLTPVSFQLPSRLISNVNFVKIVTVRFATLRRNPDGSPEHQEDIIVYANVVPDLSAADVDGDGMSDGFEEFYSGSIQMDPNGDNDSDGVSNLNEFLQGTDPDVPPDDTPQYVQPYFVCYVTIDNSNNNMALKGNSMSSATGSNSNAGGSEAPTIHWELDDTTNIQEFIIEQTYGPNTSQPGMEPFASALGTWIDVHHAGPAETSWQDSSQLTADKTYSYRVWAVKNNGTGTRIGPAGGATYTPSLELALESSKVSVSKYKYGFDEYTASPKKCYLKQKVEWTNMAGGNPESPPLDVGAGSATTTINPDTGSSTYNKTGKGSYSPIGNPTSPTSKSGTATVSYYDDPPNQVADEPGTQTVTTTLENENTTEAVRQKAVNALPAFPSLANSYWPSVEYYLSGNERNVTVGKLKYKLTFAPVQNVKLTWIERFHPQEDWSNYTDTPKTWIGSGTETPTYTIDATSGQKGTYEVISSQVYVDLILEGGDPATEDGAGGVILVNRDNDEGRWSAPSEGDYDTDYTPDKDLSTANYDDDLKGLYLSYGADNYEEGTLKLEVTAGSGKVKIWEGWGKQQLASLPKIWDFSNNEYPSNGFYVEGIQPSTSQGDVVIKLSYTNNGKTVSDEIKLTVVSLNTGLVVYRNIPAPADMEHSGVVTHYVGPLDLDGLNNVSNWLVTESAGAKAGDDLDSNPNSTMRRCTLATFISNGGPPSGAAGPGYERGFSVSGLPDEKRNEILDRVDRLYDRRGDIVYPSGLPKCLVPYGPTWDGTIEDIQKIRCDAVPEVAYELSGVNVWGARIGGPGSNVFGYPIQNFLQEHLNLAPYFPDPYTQLSPKAQRGGFGNTNTHMIRVPFFEPKSLIYSPHLLDQAP